MPRAFKEVRGGAGIQAQALGGDRDSSVHLRSRRDGEAWGTFHGRLTSSMKKLGPPLGTEGTSVLAREWGVVLTGMGLLFEAMKTS